MTKLMPPKWQVSVTGVCTAQKMPGLRTGTSQPRSAGNPP